MALFSRRILQRMINENSTFLTPKQLNRHVRALERGCLATEWEIALLNALSKSGHVQHEPETPGSSKPDILFSLVNEPKQKFIADITTVSDSGKKKQFPFETVRERFTSLIKKEGISGRFWIEVGPRENARSGRKEPNLPGQAYLEDFIFSTLQKSWRRLQGIYPRRNTMWIPRFTD